MISLEELYRKNKLFDNRYELISQIGKGGFSEVWLAKDTTANFEVALKVYITDGKLDEESKELFRSEFKAICALHHTNIIHAVGFGIYNDEAPYLCMTVCKEGSAKKLIGKNTEEELWNFIEQVASGLSYLHNRDIIHQDIKPDNVLINEGQYLIIDFGISAKSRNTLRQSENGNNGCGTTWYMSAESFDNNMPSVFARDIWAFGATLYELMTGDVPFGQLGGLTQRGRNGEIPEIAQNYSDDIKQLTYKCLSLETWDRPSAEKILEIVDCHNKDIEINWNDNGSDGKDGSDGKKDEESSKRKKYFVTSAVAIAILAFLTFGYVYPEITKDDIVANKYDSLYLANIENMKTVVVEQSSVIMKQNEASKISIDPMINEIKRYSDYRTLEDSVTPEAKNRGAVCKDTIKMKVNSVCEFLKSRANQKLEEYGEFGQEAYQKYMSISDSIEKYSTLFIK